MILHNKTAQVRTETVSRVGGSEVIGGSGVNTVCDFWSSSLGRGGQSDSTRESRGDAYDVIIPVSMDGQVTIGDLIELFYTDGSSRGKYKINSIDVFKLGDPSTDNILLKVGPIGNG